MTKKTPQGLGDLVSRLAQTNVELWHEEDKAREPEDAGVARAKRQIDLLNQRRNDLIEAIDDQFLQNSLSSPRKRGSRIGFPPARE
ncbi:MAG: hypothetical protein A2992_07665 [Elusimicrobia bacterium RIFCSPLOWO2_01_FULL_59_12]|nr:MAG: hypothetical protein A2992_07665 [Elusimicrobia bacterium RIFCSPLOWO2_01_FULL_59_12]